MEAPTNAKIKTLGAEIFKLAENQDGSLRLKFLFPQIMALVSTMNWLDEDGFAVQTTMQLGGLEIEIKQCSMVEAIKSSDSAEFLLNTLIFLEKEIPKSAKTVQFKIDTLNGTTIHDLYESRIRLLHA